MFRALGQRQRQTNCGARSKCRYSWNSQYELQAAERVGYRTTVVPEKIPQSIG